jgi:hypothetical protein
VPFEVFYPGWLLELSDRSEVRQIEALLHTAESCLVDAALALGGFASTTTDPPSGGLEAFKAGMRRRREVESIVRRELCIGEHEFGREEEISLETDRRILRQSIASGQLPREYAHRRRFLYAHSFVYSVNGFRNVLMQLARRSIGASVRPLIVNLDKALPDLAGVRNSTAHVDERIQRMARKNAITPNGGAVITDNLFGNGLRSMLADGTHGEVPVTMQSLEVCVDSFQQLVSALPWRGRPRLFPNPA